MKIPNQCLYGLLFFCFNAHAQKGIKELTYEGFDREMMDYYPSQPEGVEDATYQKGVYFLENTYDAIRDDNMQFSYADYWNITVAFHAMGLEKKDIQLAFQKTIDTGGAAICEYIESMYGDKAVSEQPLYRSIPELYQSFCQQCKGKKSITEELSPEQYAKNKGLDLELIRQLASIKEKDQRYRKNNQLYDQNLKKQQQLDQENMIAAASLLVQYGYPGKTLAGEKHALTLWAVIQHSTLPFMEKYLPLIHQAVDQKELDKGPLKMLLDRIYWLKHGMQLFGSQQDIPMASKEVIQSVKQAYRL